MKVPIMKKQSRHYYYHFLENHPSKSASSVGVSDLLLLAGLQVKKMEEHLIDEGHRSVDLLPQQMRLETEKEILHE